MEPLPDTLERRRVRRRQQTVTEIGELALEIMAIDGVGGLTIASIARRMGIKPPSVYKHVPSLMAVYDGLFQRGHAENLAELERAMVDRLPGLPALQAGLEATARWAFLNPLLAELLFWRPVPGYQPTPEAMAPAATIATIVRNELVTAADAGQLSRKASSSDGLALLAALHFGVISQHLANEPARAWAYSRFARAHRRIPELLVAAFPPD